MVLLTGLLVTGIVRAQEKTAAARPEADSGELSFRHRAYLDSARSVKAGDLKKSIDYITQSIASLGEQGYDREMSESLATLGEVYLYHGQTDLAIANLEEALDTYKSSRTAIQLAMAYLANGSYEKATEVLLPLLEVEGLVPYQRVEIYEALGDSKAGLGQSKEAIDYFKEALGIAEKNQIAPKVADLNSKIADTYAGANRLQEAKAYYDNSLELSSQQAPARAIREKEKVADFYSRNKQYDEEIALRKKSLDELRGQAAVPAESAQAGNEALLSRQQVAYKIANAYIAKDQHEQAIPYLQESIAEAGAGDDLDVQKEATRTLSEVYRERGDYSRALATYQQYVTLVDSVYKRKEKELASVAQFNREIAEKQSRITGLEQERALSKSRYELALSEQNLIQEQSKRQQLVIYSLILGMILLALTAYFFYRSNRQQKLANNLLALKSLRSQMNPHFIFNALNSVNNYIARNDERSANRFLSEFSALMRAVLENSEEDFIPLSRELELLALYLKLEHSRFPEKFDYKVNIDENLRPEGFQIPPMLLQPYIENAIWHGLRYREDKGFLEVALEEVVPGTLQISITDNGIGRKQSEALKTPHQKKQRSKGMENIQKRIHILNDMYGMQIGLRVTDLEADGSGTRVVLTLKRRS